jgi:hypothetical protein
VRRCVDDRVAHVQVHAVRGSRNVVLRLPNIFHNGSSSLVATMFGGARSNSVPFRG